MIETSQRSSISETRIARPHGLEPVPVAVFLVWLLAVSLIAAVHVVTRDEVKALSIANSGGFATIFRNLKYEGHPMLWYLTLHAAYLVYSNPVILKIVSIGIAAAGVALLLFRSPFPLWFRILFICGLPAYEYSIMARNYGISMLLLFVFASLYTREKRNSLLLGVTLLLLANTNAHSIMLAGILAAVWTFHTVVDSGRIRGGRFRSLIPGLAVALLGMAFSAITVAQSGGRNQLIDQVPGKADTRVAENVLATLVDPGSQFTAVTALGQGTPVAQKLGWSAWNYATLAGILSTALILLAIAGLLPTPLLAAAGLVSFWLLALFFEFVAPGFNRHEGLLIVFLVTLYWIGLATRSQRLSSRGPVLWCFLPLMALMCMYAAAKDVREITAPAGSAKQLSRLLDSRPDLRGAILISWPDYMLESVPYYAKNQIHFLCPGQTGSFVIWTPGPKCRLTLHELVNTAENLHNQSGRPVVLLLENKLDAPSGEATEDFSVLSWAPGDSSEISERMNRVASLRGAFLNENYDVYTLR